MITPLLTAKMTCDEKGCRVEMPVQLALQVSGGFAFKPRGEHSGWQILASGAGGLGPFATFCPEHAGKKTRPLDPVIQQASIIKSTH